MIKFCLPFAVFLFLSAVACEPPPSSIDIARQKGVYPQDFKTNVALLVLEWASREPRVMASGYLLNREKGIFFTAKHFTDAFKALGSRSCKVFFNGKVYEADLVKVPPIRDAALIRIASDFSPDDFPELPSIASKIPDTGDKVYVNGIHAHPFNIRLSNAYEGFSDRTIPIFEKYYGQETKDLSKETQVVFDDLEGVVTKPNPNSILNNLLMDEEEKKAALEYENDDYIKVLTVRDHKFFFSGLSGGAAVNEKGEIVGVITAQNPTLFELDEEGFFYDPNTNNLTLNIKQRLFNTIYITPVWSINDLVNYAKEAK